MVVLSSDPKRARHGEETTHLNKKNLAFAAAVRMVAFTTSSACTATHFSINRDLEVGHGVDLVEQAKSSLHR